MIKHHYIQMPLEILISMLAMLFFRRIDKLEHVYCLSSFRLPTYLILKSIFMSKKISATAQIILLYP